MSAGWLDRDSMLLVHAYVDGELGPADALAMMQRIAAEPVLAAECERIEALRVLLRERLPRVPAPPGLRARIEAAVGLPRRRAQPSWHALAAAVALAAVLASGSTVLTMNTPASDSAGDAIVSGHIRALMAPQPIDVASSDRHTVKPWFNGRIAGAPRVVDLAQDGFPLVGGRLDVVDRVPVPTLVYRHRFHLISVTAVADAGRFDEAPTAHAIDGYNVVRWRDGATAYWAVSDIAAGDLAEFVHRFCAAPPDQ